MTGTVPLIRLVIPGNPVGKARPRVTAHGTFTPAKTKRAEADVRAIWREAGSKRLPDGPVVVYMQIFVERPASHYTSKGALSATGRRNPFPCRKPDIDNQIKLLTDALNGLSYRDDSQIVDVYARRRWASDESARECEGSVTVVTLLAKTGAHILDADDPEDVAAQTPGGALHVGYPVPAFSNGGVNQC